MNGRRWGFGARESEMATIAEVTGTDEGGCVVVAGPPGVGKTRLAREALRIAGSTGRPTGWAAGTRAAAVIPLGALAHLLPAVELGSSPLALLQHAVTALRELGGAGRCLVGIDDAHLLDELSATLVHQIALSGSAALVLTVRTGEPAPDPVSALWKDGLAARIELEPLRRPDMERLLRASLAGPVDARTAERLWRLTSGNPLYLRELIELGRTTGALQQRGDVWHWAGGVTPSPRLTEVIRDHLGKVTPTEWAALEKLAISGALPLSQLDGDSGAISGLERRGLVVVERAGRRAEVRLVHPLHAEVVQAQMSEVVVRRLRRELACAGPDADERDVLLAGQLLLDSEEPNPDVDLLTDAAVRANALLQHAVAERFARVAVEGGAVLRAHVALLEALHWQGRFEDAEQVAVAAAGVAGSDVSRAQLAVLRARNLYCGLGRATDAESALRAAEAVVTPAEVRARVVGARGILTFLTGRPRQAIELGAAETSVLGDGVGPRPTASAVSVAALAVTGRVQEALAAAASGWSVIERHRLEPETTFSRLMLAHGELLALWVAGRLVELQTRASELHRLSMVEPEWAGDAIAAMHMGWAALAAGRLATAVRWLTEAFAGLNHCDPGGLLPLCTAQLAQAHAQLGDVAASGELLAGLRDRGRGHLVFEPDVLLARAWYAAARDRESEAAELALRAGAIAGGAEQWAVEAAALHTAAQLGRADVVAPRLRKLAGQVEGEFVAGFAAHAEAQAAADGGRLDDVAADFERMGAYLLAADAAAHAAGAHTRAGDRRRAASATATAAALARECENASTPSLSSLALPRLTGREAEIAGLAGQGMHNRAIAARLVVSVRTVEAHLANAYSKLGITSRKQLADALLLSRLGNRSTPDNRTGGDIPEAVTVPTQTRRSREFSTSGGTAWPRN